MDNTKKIIEESEIIIEQIKKYSPQLGSFFDLKNNFREYSADLYNFVTPPEHIKRQKLIKNKIKQKITQLFGESALEKFQVNLEGGLAFNIADHHQILNHPILVSSNVISSASKLLNNQKPPAIVVISSGDVPPNNYFGKNGFTFHNQKIPIFSNSERELTSYYIPKRDFDFIDRLKAADKWKDLTTEEQAFLSQECVKIKSYDYSKCQDYKDQISIIVKNYWPYIFEESLRKNLPELIYITQEEIVTQCLIELLEEDNDNIISRCLFDDIFRKEIINNFRGIVVTWNEAEEKGTHFFWRKYPNRSQSLRLYIQGNQLMPVDDRFSDLGVPLDKKIIIELLKKREIYPSLFTIFGVLNFYAGIKPLTGYGSIIYLNLMKQAWLKTLKKFNLSEEIKLMETVEAKGLIAGVPIFFKREGDKLKTLYAFDIIYEGGISAQYLQTIFNMDFADFMTVGSIDMYDYISQKYIPSEEKLKPSISSDDLASVKFNWL